MPFDPKLIHDDDVNFEGDLQLPDDLALMAQQLGDDAARLAASYPPSPLVVPRLSGLANPLKRGTTNFWFTRSLAGTALAVGLVAISLVAWNFNTVQTGERPAPKIGMKGVGENGGTAVPSHRPAYAGRSRLAHESPSPTGQVPVTPASWLGDASGPELEALMDLWEQDQPAVRSLSF